MLAFLEESIYQPIETGVFSNSSSAGPGSDNLKQTCTVLYRLRVTDEQLLRFDLIRRDQILLGTLMTRLCRCVCRQQFYMYRGRRALRACDVGATFMREALKGAHVVVQGDQGWFYRW
eukprot:CAMPEP_0117744046 /NCGR_PEP_ID=MMETSP0947-20121206/6514_1 /TAXON_ID=44440 /ORGANISM="Chattonella subsalsa, Strain CCMP2191" /LENGTH=117 /DNA_ID=CAMNT_0005560897 /DNA_START=217 /DNA_END=567 /DNA_ORIENTATION=+